MRIAIEATDLAKGLSIAAKGMSGKSFLPVLDGVLFELREDGKITLTGSDGEVFVRKTIEASPTLTPVSMILPKALVSAIGELPSVHGQYAELKITAPARLSVKAGSVNMTVSTLDADEFPAFPGGLAPAWAVVVPREEFRDAVAKVAFIAASATGSMANVRLATSPEGLILEATDGYRLASKALPIVGAETAEALIHGKQLSDAMKLFTEGNDIQILAHENVVVFASETMQVAVRAGAAAFPATAGVLAKVKDGATAVTLPWAPLVDAFARATGFANGNAVTIRLADDASEVSISVTSNIGVFQESIFLTEKAEGFPEVYVSPTLALPMLKAARDTEVTLATKPRSGILVTHQSDPGWQAIVMPVSRAS